ncbi:MAG: hypothetical protein ABSH48_17605 [Verrucomicrobiota bacterium]
MSLSVCVRGVAVSVVWTLALTFGFKASAQTSYYSPEGTEYPIIGSLPGDQVMPSAAISPTGGFVVWQDNITDGAGWGVSARQLDGTLSGTLSTFRVNATGAGDQENAKVALLKNGGAVFVWQGGVEGYQHVFARFLTPTNTFLTSTDVPVSAFNSSSSFQVNPQVAVLNNSNVVVTWASFNEAGPYSLLDVYAKILSPSGQTISNEFLVNQFTNYNQRTPALAALPGGGFVVAWVSELERGSLPALNETNGTSPSAIGTASVDVYARLFLSSGAAAGSEFLVDQTTTPCANPAIAVESDGGFAIAWSQLNLVVSTNGWDVYGRTFTSAGAGGNAIRLNTYLPGNQYAPQLAAIGADYLAVWTSMGQDGSREGVYGQFFHDDGSLVGGEFRVNTTTISQQMQPALASDGGSQFLAVWTSFVGLPSAFDLYAQRFVNVASVLQPMSAPNIWAPFVVSNGVYQPQLVVSWAPLQGLSVSDYEVYADGAATPTVVVTTNSWTMTAANGLTASSTHSFALDYVTTDGRRSPLSPAASGTTWGGISYFGIPLEWMQEYYGSSIASWPTNVNAPLVAGGPSLYQVFLSGGSPTNPGTWLSQQLTQTAQGMFLGWNTQPGATYQVQVSSNLTTWSNVGSPRFAAGTTDSMYVGGNPSGYYRVVLLRQ